MIRSENFIYRSIGENEYYKVDLTQFGWHKNKPDVNSVPCVKKDYVVHFVVEGKGNYIVDGRTITVEKNSMFLLRPNEHVFYYPNKLEPWEYYWIGFNGEDAERLASEMGFDHNKYVIEASNINAVVSVIKEMCQPDVETASPLYFKSRFFDVADKLTVRSRNESRLSPEDSVNLYDALEYIKKNVSKNITVASLSSDLLVDRTWLFRIFKKKYGMSPSEYILSYKLELAQEYLAETQLPIKTIAQNLGFDNYVTFSKAYRKKFGYSAKDYRAETLKLRSGNL